jgi:hypothetical protein
MKPATTPRASPPEDEMELVFRINPDLEDHGSIFDAIAELLVANWLDEQRNTEATPNHEGTSHEEATRD